MSPFLEMSPNRSNLGDRLLAPETFIKKPESGLMYLKDLAAAIGAPELGLGFYDSRENISLEQAQEQQTQYLLDQVQCQQDTRFLEIGTWSERNLKKAASRQARSWGITRSGEIARSCRERGWNVRKASFLDLGREWSGQFDGVLAHGIFESYAKVEDALLGQDDLIYRNLFRTAHRVLDPKGPNGRFVTTILCFQERLNPRNIHWDPKECPTKSDEFHLANLTQIFGTWYPTRGQMVSSSKGLFKLIHEEDGTSDFYRSSQVWLKGFRQSLFSLNGGAIFTFDILRNLRNPIAVFRILQAILPLGSWNWQSRGKHPPVHLLRQTWQKVS